MERTSREFDRVIQLRRQCLDIVKIHLDKVPTNQAQEFYCPDENNSGACLPIVLGRVLGKQVQKEDRQIKESIEQMKKGKSTSIPLADPFDKYKEDVPVVADPKYTHAPDPGINADPFSLRLVNKWYEPDKYIDFIFGIDPAMGESKAGGRIILRTEKQVKWKKGDCLNGPNGIRFKVVNIGWWTWLYRILSISKYYNAKLTLIAEK